MVHREAAEFEEAPAKAEADAVRDAFPQNAGSNPARAASALSGADGATRAWTISRLQQGLGNAYVQRVVAESDQRGTPAVQRQLRRPLLEPSAISGTAMRVVEQSEGPVRNWLDAETERLRYLSVNGILLRVRRLVPQAADLADVQLTRLVKEWAKRHNHTMPRLSLFPERGEPGVPSAKGPSISDSALVSKLRGVFSSLASIPTEINVEQGHGRVNISVSGTTIEHTAGQRKTGMTLEWDGSIGFSTSYQGLTLAGKLSKDEWKMVLSYPGTSSMPNLTQLEGVFRAGGAGLRGIVEATGDMKSLNDVSAVKGAISPHLEKVKAAVEAASQIAAAKPGDVIFGMEAKGPGPGAEPSSQASFQFTATLTIIF